MGRAFNKKEIENIREKLVVKGEDIFAEHGLKKTSIGDLTEAAGIGKGTFYRFYESKEVLFMEILNRADLESKEKIREYKEKKLKREKGAIYQMMRKMFDLIMEKPLLLKLFSNSEDFLVLLNKVPEELIQEHLEEDDKFFLDFFEELKKEGYVKKNIDNRIVFGMVKSVIVTLVNRDIIGRESVEEVADTQIRLIADWIEDIDD